MASVIPLAYDYSTGGVVVGFKEPAAGDKIGAVWLDAQPIGLSGLYSARPAANTVTAGVIYTATDVKEAYRSNGSAWALADSGGSELGYAETTSAFDATSSTLTDVPGLFINSSRVGERAFYVSFGATLRATGGGAGTLALIINGSQRSQIVYSGNVFQYLNRIARISDLTPGSTPVIKLQASTTAGTFNVFASSSDRASLSLVNL